jgi:solute carrier family 25 folate transporter 32
MQRSESRGTLRGRMGRWTDALAGCAAGVAPVVALQPLEVAKTRAQALGRPLSPLSDLRALVSTRGIRPLWFGTKAAVVGAGAAWGVYFFTYNALMREGVLYREPGACALCAGSIASALTAPLFLAKTRLSLGEGAGGVLPCLASVTREEGFLRLWKGLLPSLALVPNGALQFALYERFRRLALLSPSWSSTGAFAARPSSESSQQHVARKPAAAAVLGAASKAGALCLTYPIQTVRARLHRTTGLTIVGAFRSATASPAGLLGLYRGMLPALAQALPRSSITFFSYEIMQSILRV